METHKQKRMPGLPNMAIDRVTEYKELCAKLRENNFEIYKSTAGYEYKDTLPGGWTLVVLLPEIYGSIPAFFLTDGAGAFHMLVRGMALDPATWKREGFTHELGTAVLDALEPVKTHVEESIPEEQFKRLDDLYRAKDELFRLLAASGFALDGHTWYHKTPIDGRWRLGMLVCQNEATISEFKFKGSKCTYYFTLTEKNEMDEFNHDRWFSPRIQAQVAKRLAPLRPWIELDPALSKKRKAELVAKKGGRK